MKQDSSLGCIVSFFLVAWALMILFFWTFYREWWN